MPTTHSNFRPRSKLCISSIRKLCGLSYLSKHLIAVFISLFIINLSAHAEDVILRHSFAGKISFELTGNTLRDSTNTCNAIAGGQSSGSISLPSNASIKAAYLYWSGSGGIDTQVNLNGQPVNSDANYIEAFSGRNYYSAKANVTNLVSNNAFASYQVSGLSFDGSNSYCSTGGAYGGWALAIVFEHADEPLRVINVFDGFKNFWGSEFTLIPNNFVIAANPSSKGGKHAHITWEGDDGNSQARGGFTESLKFEGFDLTNFPLNPADNQFNGYSNVTGTTSGVDIDEYEIGNYLNAGDTSVNTTYSSGQDAVFLTAEFISVPNEPVADLSIEQTGPTSFIRGQTNDVTFKVDNLGPNDASINTEITLPLPTGISLNSFTGTSWNCSELANTLKCIYLNNITNGSSSTALLVRLNTSSATADSINLVATVIGIKFDNILSNNTDSQTYAISSSDLTTSTKIVSDINGGNVQPGDTLRYQIDIIESSGIPGYSISVNDHLPEYFSSFNVISIPNGAIDNSQTSPSGNNSAGLVSISNINIAASATVSIIIDAVIKTSVANDSEIINSATISGSGGIDTQISSSTIYVSHPVNPATGNKPLYLRQSSNLSRIQPTSTAFISLNDLAEVSWIISPAFQKEFQFSGSVVTSYLFLQNSFTQGSWGHDLTLTLLHNGNSIGSVQRNISVPSTGVTNDSVALFEFSIPLSSQPIIQPGDSLSLKIFNDSQYSEDSIYVYSIDPDTQNTDAVSPYSLISLPAATVINVDKITIIDNVTLQPVTQAAPSESITIQAKISDPFGSFDINAARISISDADGVNMIDQQSMSLLADSGIAHKTFQYSYPLPSDASLGDWKFAVTAFEGVENEINHRSESLLKIVTLLPDINIIKSVVVFSDPINGENSSNSFSKALPGALLTYTLTAINQGPGAAQNDSIWISDSVPSKTYLSVSDFDSIPGTGPIIKQSSLGPSGLTYYFESLNSSTDDIEFSNTNGANFTYSPVANSDGIDKNITHFRINPKGIFQAPAAGESPTQFTIKFRVQLQ